MTRHGIPIQVLEKLTKDFKIPLGRWGTPEEMAEFISFVASDKASYMTGQIVNVDGGLLVHSPSIKFD
uniref:Peroxisomal trans-2-enoyl-CoA reductase n=1 Tax=Panagrolaimus davidi TaxID=227884 RepID=A0A914PFL5_9BILA